MQSDGRHRREFIHQSLTDDSDKHVAFPALSEVRLGLVPVTLAKHLIPLYGNIRKEIIQKYRSDYDLISKLDSYNSSGLERFRMRVSSVTRPRVGVMNMLKKRC